MNTPIIVLDQSGGGSNAIAWAAFCWGYRKSEPLVPVLRVWRMRAIADAKAKGLTSDNVADLVVRDARAVGAQVIAGDQHAEWTWASAFRVRGLRFESYPWSNPAKNDAIVRLRELISSRRLSIEPGDEADALIKEAAFFEERITPSGAVTFGGRKGNDDRVAVLLLAARLDAELKIPGSPVRAGRTHKLLVANEDGSGWIGDDDERARKMLASRTAPNLYDALGLDRTKVEILGFTPRGGLAIAKREPHDDGCPAIMGGPLHSRPRFIRAFQGEPWTPTIDPRLTFSTKGTKR